MRMFGGSDSDASFSIGEGDWYNLERHVLGHHETFKVTLFVFCEAHNEMPSWAPNPINVSPSSCCALTGTSLNRPSEKTEGEPIKLRTGWNPQLAFGFWFIKTIPKHMTLNKVENFIHSLFGKSYKYKAKRMWIIAITTQQQTCKCYQLPRFQPRLV